MVDTREQFVLALKGWTYKGILDNWFYGISDPAGPVPYHGFMSEDNIGVGTYIPGNKVIRKEKNTEHTLLFLDDHTYYELGIRDTTR